MALKNTITWLLVIAPFFSFSQGVKANLYDKFIKKQRVETESISIAGLTGNTRLSMALSAVGSTLYLTISGAGWGAATADIDNELKLLFSNDSVVTLKSTALQGFEPGMLQNSYQHQYLVAANQLEALMSFSLIGIRKYSFATFSDLDIPQQNSKKLNKLSALFVEELKKANLLRLLRQINVKDIRNHIGDSVKFCSKVYKTRYFEGSADGPTLLDVQANFSDPVVNVVILEKDRQNFNGAPEVKYLNKDVCISGVVTLRNNIPYLVVHDRKQIAVTSPIDVAEIELFKGDSITTKGNVFTTASKQSNETVIEKAESKPTKGVAAKRERTPEIKSVQAEKAAEFPGGDSAFALFIRKQMDMPETFLLEEQKNVAISFDVDAKGVWRNMQLVTTAGEKLDNELIKALQRMPRWIPANRNGVPVASQVVHLITLVDRKAVLENHSAVKVLPNNQKKEPVKDIPDPEKAVSLAKNSMTQQPPAEKKQEDGQKFTATHSVTSFTSEEKDNAKVVRTNNNTTGKAEGNRYKVRSKAYFHNEPDKSTRRNAFIVHWNNAILKPSEEENGFIYIVFTNHQGQVSKGWLSKGDLIEVK